jgi:hypothetical protein
MEGDRQDDLGSDTAPDPLHDEHETVEIPCPEALALPSPVETALAQYADSIERMSAGAGFPTDPYTRGFVAGLRAAIAVAASALKSETGTSNKPPEV